MFKNAESDDFKNIQCNVNTRHKSIFCDPSVVGEISPLTESLALSGNYFQRLKPLCLAKDH